MTDDFATLCRLYRAEKARRAEIDVLYSKYGMNHRRPADLMKPEQIAEHAGAEFDVLRQEYEKRTGWKV